MRSLRVPKSPPPSLQLGVGMMLLLTAKLPFHPSTFTTASAYSSRLSTSSSSIPSTFARSLYSSHHFARTGSAFLTRGGAYGKNFHSSSPPSLSMGSSDSADSDIPSKYYLSVQECLDIFNDPDQNAVFLDGSWHLGKDRDGREEYEAGPRITGAKYYDIDDISSKKGDPLNPKGLPHQRPPKELHAAAMTALQIKNDDHIIIYGTEGCIFIQRVAYTLQNMGHEKSKIHLMEGSLQEWMDLGGEVETEPAKALSASDLTDESTYEANEATQFKDIDDVMDVVQKNMKGEEVDYLVVDARGAGRFKAEAPEPRAGMRGGHMPGSVNVPFMNLIDSSNTLKLKPIDQLKEAFASAGVDIEDTDKKLILSCGSGVSACVLATALQECGRDPASTFVYDGSWTEWGGDADTPIVS